MAEEGTVRFSATQVVGAALAAVAAAVAASFLGVYGTIIGAAVMSVVSTVWTVLYERTVHRSKNKLNDLRHGRDNTVKHDRLRNAWARVRAQLTRPGWWKPVGAVSLATFAIAIGVVTAIETGIGKPMAAAVTGQPSTDGTSLRAAVTASDTHSVPAPARPEGAVPSTGPRQDNSGDGAVRQREQGSSPTQSPEHRPPGMNGPESHIPRTDSEQEPHGSPTPVPTPMPDDGGEPERAQPSPQPTATR